jgi:hypothetical protein
MRTRTRAGLLTRLERLECRVAARDQPINLKRFNARDQPPGEAVGASSRIALSCASEIGCQAWQRKWSPFRALGAARRHYIRLQCQDG